MVIGLDNRIVNRSSMNGSPAVPVAEGLRDARTILNQFSSGEMRSPRRVFEGLSAARSQLLAEDAPRFDREVARFVANMSPDDQRGLRTALEKGLRYTKFSSMPSVDRSFIKDVVKAISARFPAPPVDRISTHAQGSVTLVNRMTPSPLAPPTGGVSLQGSHTADRPVDPQMQMRVRNLLGNALAGKAGQLEKGLEMALRAYTTPEARQAYLALLQAQITERGADKLSSAEVSQAIDAARTALLQRDLSPEKQAFVREILGAMSPASDRSH